MGSRTVFTAYKYIIENSFNEDKSGFFERYYWLFKTAKVLNKRNIKSN